jgi:hypothetical protein
VGDLKVKTLYRVGVYKSDCWEGKLALARLTIIFTVHDKETGSCLDLELPGTSLRQTGLKGRALLTLGKRVS